MYRQTVQLHFTLRTVYSCTSRFGQCTDKLYSCTSRFGQCTDQLHSCTSRFGQCTDISDILQTVQLYFTLRTVYRQTVHLYFTLRTVYRQTVQLHFTLQTVFRPVLGFTQPQIQWIPEAPTLEVRLKLPSSAEIKNTWSNASTFPYTITVQCLIRHADNSMVSFTSCSKSLKILHQKSRRGGVIAHRGGDIQCLRHSLKSNVDPLKLYIVVRLTTLSVNNSQNNKARTKHSPKTRVHAFILSYVLQLASKYDIAGHKTLALSQVSTGEQHWSQLRRANEQACRYTVSRDAHSSAIWCGQTV